MIDFIERIVAVALFTLISTVFIYVGAHTICLLIWDFISSI